MSGIKDPFSQKLLVWIGVRAGEARITCGPKSRLRSKITFKVKSKKNSRSTDRARQKSRSPKNRQRSVHREAERKAAVQRVGQNSRGQTIQGWQRRGSGGKSVQNKRQGLSPKTGLGQKVVKGNTELEHTN